jgi:hypothetical protein
MLQILAVLTVLAMGRKVGRPLPKSA